MTRTSPPSPPAEHWKHGTLLEAASHVRHVSVGGGLVMVGGDRLHMLRPGALAHGTRALAGDAVVTAVAAEPWAPHRYAVASPGRLDVCAGRAPDTTLFTLTFKRPEFEPTHLAWVRERGETALYLRGKSGEVGRLFVDRGVFEEVDVTPMAAIAGDPAGVLAMLTLAEGEEEVRVQNEDGTFECRPLTIIPEGEEGEDLHVYLAVHGRSVAYSLDDWATLVSFGDGEDFHMIGSLMWGPVAFRDERTVLVGYSVETTVSIQEGARGGEAATILAIDRDLGDGVEPKIHSLAWDATRHAIFAASPELGLLVAHAPLADGETRTIPS